MPDPSREKIPDDAPLVALRRGGLLEIVESVHRGRYAVCDPSGQTIDSLGDESGYFYPRSALKPFQALPLVLSGAADAFGLSDEELAVACASHYGEERHVSVVRELLQKAGLSEWDLDNGAHPPLHGPSAEDLVRRGESPGKVHGNCSGKHAGMLAVCAQKGWDTKSYRSPDHPLQRWILSLLSEFCELQVRDVIIGGDGCGAPAFAVPLKSLAVGFARFATGESLDGDLARAAGRLKTAMRRHPFMVSGTGGFDSEVLSQTGLVAKGGADGVWAAGSESGWGMVLKISDGASRAVRPVSAALLKGRGVSLENSDSFPVRDLHGERVGEMVAFCGARSE